MNYFLVLLRFGLFRWAVLFIDFLVVSVLLLLFLCVLIKYGDCVLCALKLCGSWADGMVDDDYSMLVGVGGSCGVEIGETSSDLFGCTVWIVFLFFFWDLFSCCFLVEVFIWGGLCFLMFFLFLVIDMGCFSFVFLFIWLLGFLGCLGCFFSFVLMVNGLVNRGFSFLLSGSLAVFGLLFVLLVLFNLLVLVSYISGSVGYLVVNFLLVFLFGWWICYDFFLCCLFVTFGVFCFFGSFFVLLS